MIRVEPQPEPSRFDELVRQPGLKFLSTKARPTSDDFERHAYWRTTNRELRAAYKNICAYSCFYIPEATGVDTVEHYLPKSTHPRDAYEWTNYRLVCSRLNQRKGKKEDVLDPFVVENGWFIIEFPSLLVKASPIVSAPVKQQIVDSIVRLGLNDSGTCLAQREHHVRDFCLGHVSFSYLQKDAPFLAAEIERQDLVQTLPSVMQYPAGDM